ncbi:aminotransferase class IV family protein [Streptomyces sp. NPDC058470]|uniref:aminotransferase class IV family protein n=1 Tax=Streptomyces sp. NPDC058470 TaxID=3346515 RepID=UPI003645FB27
MLGRMVTLDGKPAGADDLLPLALTNFAHFTSMRVGADGSIRGLSLHLERLVRDCRTVYGVALDADRVRVQVRAALHGRPGPCVVRVTIYDPAVDMGHPVDAKDPQPLITVRPVGQLPPPPLRVQSVRYERDLPQVKHCGLFGALHARRAAQLAGADDALFTGCDGLVSEGGTWNVGFIDGNGTVVWPDAPVLPGVTMALLKQHAVGVSHRTAAVTLGQAKSMAAAFATNTSIGVRALSALDNESLSTDHPVLTALRDSYLSVPGESL